MRILSYLLSSPEALQLTGEALNREHFGLSLIPLLKEQKNQLCLYASHLPSRPHAFMFPVTES